MVDAGEEKSNSTSDVPNPKEESKKTKERRTIPGNFSYTTTPGKLKIALDKIIEAERPDNFNKNYIETYLTVSGGSAAPIPNILKRVGFISGEGRPTELYGRFQTEGARAEAALEGLKAGFAELFKKNTFAHSLPEEKIKDLLIEITGLKKSDVILNNIYGTFDAFRSFVPASFVSGGKSADPDKNDIHDQSSISNGSDAMNLGLSYHINIVLPETKDVAVFNAIFQSLKQNLLS
jgi:Family of unknown function (DUF5343)